LATNISPLLVAGPIITKETKEHSVYVLERAEVFEKRSFEIDA